MNPVKIFFGTTFIIIGFFLSDMLLECYSRMIPYMGSDISNQYPFVPCDLSTILILIPILIIPIGIVLLLQGFFKSKQQYSTSNKQMERTDIE